MRLPEYKHKKARIEIVPMIDTIFFLLVYFMIASLNMTSLPSKKVSLPVSATAVVHPPQDQIVVTVTRAGVCYIDHNAIAESDLTSGLRARLKSSPNAPVVINCDKSRPVATFTTVFDLVKQAGPASVMVATTPSDSWAVH